jgi:hypothetical protein
MRKSRDERPRSSIAFADVNLFSESVNCVQKNIEILLKANIKEVGLEKIHVKQNISNLSVEELIACHLLSKSQRMKQGFRLFRAPMECGLSDRRTYRRLKKLSENPPNPRGFK